MQRFINDPDHVVEDMLIGFLKAHRDLIHECSRNPRVVVSNTVGNPARVGLVAGGGSGHEPVFIGYCGAGLIDAVAVGEIFSSPTARAFSDAIREADTGMGVVCLIGNYAGDNMNVRMAQKQAARDGIEVRIIIANDDVVSALKGKEHLRRGVAGEIFMWKIAAARAAEGASLEEVAAAAQRSIDNAASVGVGLAPCTIPANGKPNFNIADGTLEFGIGHHGEPGAKVESMRSAADIATEMCGAVLEDKPLREGEACAVLISGLGATPLMEQYIVFAEVEKILHERGIRIQRAYVGDYFTSLEMNGISLTVMKLDDQLERLLGAPCTAVGLTQMEKG